MSKTNFKKKIISFYNDFLMNTSINSSESVAWSTKNSQYTRFKTLFHIGVTEYDTILDLGCGMGHMVDYLKSLNYPTKNYRGIDINQNYITWAIQRNLNVNFSVGEIFDITDNFDYILGSGVFTVGMNLDEIISAIDYSFNLCNKGVAFNFLTKKYIDISEFNTFNPEDFYNLIKEKYKNTELVTGYLGDEDFTIYIYK